MNSYSFPEHVPISDSARNLITKILNLDPTKRPNLDEILGHQFLNNGGSIPRSLPLSTLACPPSANYIKQYLPTANSMRISMKGDDPLSTQTRTAFPLGNINTLRPTVQRLTTQTKLKQQRPTPFLSQKHTTQPTNTKHQLTTPKQYNYFTLE
jgi:serine/threonine protein kinase